MTGRSVRAPAARLRRGAALLAAVLATAACSDGSILDPDCPPVAGRVAPSTAVAPESARLPSRGSSYEAAFREAGEDFGVPTELLRAVAWEETRWQMVRGEEEFPGRPPAFGVMALRGDRLARGAALAGVSAEAARTDARANIRSAAALLDSLADAAGLDRSELASWAPAVAEFSGIELAAGRDAYLRRGVYGALGVSLPRDAGGGAPGTPPGPSADHVPFHECPEGPDDPDPDPDPGADDPEAIWRPSPNFDARPADGTGDVHMVIVHTCEGNYAGCWSWLTNPASEVSSHYVVNEEGTEISQLVREEDRAWHIAASYDCALNHGHDCRLNGVQGNHFTVGIEHAGFASQDSFPAGQVEASAALVCRVSQRTGMPRDYRHVVAHGRLQANRTDPGLSWPWADYVTSIQRHCGETVVDDSSAFHDGDVARVDVPAAWTATDQTPGYYAGGYRWAPTWPSSDDALVFSFRLEEPGSRTVEARWTEGGNRSAAARYHVLTAAGDTLATVERDQRKGGGAWRELGSWSFPAGWNEVHLSRRGASGSVVVGDAVRVR